MNFVDNTIDLPWRKILSAEFGTKVPEGSSLIFGDTRIFLLQSVGRVEGSLRSKNRTFAMAAANDEFVSSVALVIFY